jgi:putative restriction endonuclease
VGYDAAFDNLLITFDQNGDLILAPDFLVADANAIGITTPARLRHIHSRHRPYLDEHRARFLTKISRRSHL